MSGLARTFATADEATGYLTANPVVESVVVGGINFSVLTDAETGQRIARSSVDALELIRLQPERYGWNAPTGVAGTPPSGHYDRHTNVWNSTDRAPRDGEVWIYDSDSNYRFIRSDLDAKEIVRGNPARFSFTVPGGAQTKRYERFVPDTP